MITTCPLDSGKGRNKQPFRESLLEGSTIEFKMEDDCATYLPTWKREARSNICAKPWSVLIVFSVAVKIHQKVITRGMTFRTS